MMRQTGPTSADAQSIDLVEDTLAEPSANGSQSSAAELKLTQKHKETKGSHEGGGPALLHGNHKSRPTEV